MSDDVFRSSPRRARGPFASRRRQASLLLIALVLVSACSRPSDVSFFVLVKSSNYAQSSDGSLTLLNYHFFSEIFLKPNGSVTSASVARADSPDAAMEYVDQGDNYYMEGGHFDSRDEVDEAHPNGRYVFNLESPSVQIRDLELRLEGPAGGTDIPEPVTISLWQGDSPVSPIGIDPDQDLIVRWTSYSNGSEDPRGIVDDMIFVVVADCRGERVFHTGLPFQGDYLKYRASEVLVERGTLHAGEPYSAFVEFPHVSDSRVEKGVPGFTSYATATYLDLHTTGTASDRSCPDVRPPMDTGQTGPVEAEGNAPTILALARSSSSSASAAGTPRLDPPNSGRIAALMATTRPSSPSTGPPLPPLVVAAS